MALKRVCVLIATAALAAATMLALVASPAQAALRHIDGTVVSKHAANQTFRVTTQNGNRVRIRVNAATQFQRIPGGFSGLHAGLRIEIEAKPTTDGLLAKHVETRGGGGGGGDDGPNHT